MRMRKAGYLLIIFSALGVPGMAFSSKPPTTVPFS